MTIIKPFYYKGDRGNKLYDLELLLWIYVLQMACNVAADKNTGLVKKIETTAANVHDVTQMAGLVDGTEGECYLTAVVSMPKNARKRS